MLTFSATARSLNFVGSNRCSLLIIILWDITGQKDTRAWPVKFWDIATYMQEGSLCALSLSVNWPYHTSVNSPHPPLFHRNLENQHLALKFQACPTKWHPTTSTKSGKRQPKKAKRISTEKYLELASSPPEHGSANCGLCPSGISAVHKAVKSVKLQLSLAHQ